MNLLPCTSQVIAKVERLTNRPVHIVQEPKLSTLAHLQIARGDAPFHLLRYKPSGATPPDYLIAHQCGYVLRLYSAPPEKRFDFASCPEGRTKIGIELQEPRLPDGVRAMGEFLLGGLITQLRSIPVGFRIDEWVEKTFPELALLQRNAVVAQLETNSKAIAAAGSGNFPAKVAKASLGMNAAFAAFWGRKWADPTPVVPYKAIGLAELGQRLLTIYDRTPDDAVTDVQLVGEWAFELELQGWYDAIPFTGAN